MTFKIDGFILSIEGILDVDEEPMFPLFALFLAYRNLTASPQLNKLRWETKELYLPYHDYFGLVLKPRGEDFERIGMINGYASVIGEGEADTKKLNL